MHLAQSGVPSSAEGWLLTVARNRWRDIRKSAAYRTSTSLEDAPALSAAIDELDPDAIPDERLALQSWST